MEVVIWGLVSVMALCGPIALVVAVKAYRKAKQNEWDIQRIDSYMEHSLEAEQSMAEQMFKNQTGEGLGYEDEAELEDLQ